MVHIIPVGNYCSSVVSFLGSIMPNVPQNRGELSKFVGDEKSRSIQLCRPGGKEGRK